MEVGSFLMEIDYSLMIISVCMRFVEIGGLTFVEIVVLAQQCLASIAVIFQPTHLTVPLEAQSILDSSLMEEEVYIIYGHNLAMYSSHKHSVLYRIELWEN